MWKWLEIQLVKSGFGRWLLSVLGLGGYIGPIVKNKQVYSI